MKTTLLAVVGLSPQVITETLYAMHQNNKQIHCIHVITTRDGRDKINSELLAGKKGHYYQYLEDYGYYSDDIEFGYNYVHTAQNEYGEELTDIITESDNEFLLQTCMNLTFCLTSNPNHRVYFSVAGGRKTMSACLTLAAQLYARPQDRMYHVIISPEFESNRQFYYPPVQSTCLTLYDKNGQPFYKESKYAKIYLINIPFISVRDRLTQNELQKPYDPSDLMTELIKDDSCYLRVDLISRKITYNKMIMDMNPAHLALYAFFVMEKKQCKKAVAICSTCRDCFMDIQTIFKKQDQLSEVYHKIRGHEAAKNISDTGINNLNAENFNMYKGKIKTQLRKVFGPYALKIIEIASEGIRPSVKYGIMIDKDRLEIVY